MHTLPCNTSFPSCCALLALPVASTCLEGTPSAVTSMSSQSTSGRHASGGRARSQPGRPRGTDQAPASADAAQRAAASAAAAAAHPAPDLGLLRRAVLAVLLRALAIVDWLRQPPAWRACLYIFLLLCWQAGVDSVREVAEQAVVFGGTIQIGALIVGVLMQLVGRAEAPTALHGALAVPPRCAQWLAGRVRLLVCNLRPRPKHAAQCTLVPAPF